MNKELHSKILNLSISIFDDEEYNVVEHYINNNLLNNLRVYISDKLEYLETIFVLDRDNEILKKQVEMCQKLEDIVLDIYIETIS